AGYKKMSDSPPTHTTARYDQEAPNYSQAGSTVDGRSSTGYNRTDADTISHQDSVFSYYSFRDMAQFLKSVHGRQYNVLNDAYFLPSDNTEWERL
ncbi:1297_t:CDS:2, partial [Acaulospora colombiana]